MEKSAGRGELSPAMRVVYLPSHNHDVGLYPTGDFITEKMKTLFIEGAHFLPKPYTQHQLHDAVEGLLTA